MYTPEYFIKKLDLKPHPEGGYFREIYKSTYQADAQNLPEWYHGGRALSSTIYFLLDVGQVSRFHRLKGDEIMFYHYGSPLDLHAIDADGNYSMVTLGLNIEKGEMPQVLLPAGIYFCGIPADRSSFSLISTMVSPAFEYKDFQLFNAGEICNKFPRLKATIEKLLPGEEG